MRIPLIIAAAVMLQPSPGHSEILYARPDTEVAGAQYRWGNDVVPDAMPLKAALAIAGSVNGTRALEIRLLHATASPGSVITRTIVDTPARKAGCSTPVRLDHWRK
jgi:hypothetical protein